MSAAGIAALRRREHVELRYYNDSPRNGNCTYGIGTLVHYGQCTAEELQRPVTLAQVDATLALRVSEAESAVRRNVRRKLSSMHW